MTTAALGDVADFINGFAFKPEDWQEAGLPIVRIQNLTDASKPINRTTRVVPDKFRVRKGELLVSWSATLGVFTWDRTDEALLNQHIFRVVPSDKIERSFLRHILRGALDSMGRHLHGATMQHVNRGEFLSTEIPLPPLAEQRRIAMMLDRAEDLRVKRHQVLLHLNTTTQSIFRGTFGQSKDRVTQVQLGEVVDSIDSGTSPICETRPASDGEWGVLKLSALGSGAFNPLENKAYLGDLGAMTANEVTAGDVLMSRKNTRELVGVVAVVKQLQPRLLLPDLIFRLRLNPRRVQPTYFQAMMMSAEKRAAVRNLSSGSAASMPNISKARLRSLVVEVPPMSTQARFAEAVARVDAQRAKVVESSVSSDELFASLRSRAFRGEL